MTRVGVVGLGLIGGSLLQALAASGLDPLGTDADERVLAAARHDGFPTTDALEILARECEVVLVCVPPEHAAGVAADVLASDPRVVVADATSVKVPVLRELAGRVDRAALRRFLGAHPLAGSADTGWDAADPALLRDAVWAVCPPSLDAPPEPLCVLAAALDPLGARLLVSGLAEHDAAVARTSHAPHVVAQALAALPADWPLAAALSGGAYRDMTRTAHSDPALWLEILRANRDEAGGALRALATTLGHLATAIEVNDEATLATAWREGASARAAVDAIRWSDPQWRATELDWPAYERLLELGRAGVLVRRLRLEGDRLELEVSAAG